MVDPWPNYVSMVSGLSKATRVKALAAARAVLAQAGLDDVATDAGERITKLAEEIIAASRANRELLENLVTAEVDKAATRLGLVRAEDLSQLRAEIAALRAQVIVLTAPGSDPAATAPAKKSPAKRAASKTAGSASTAPERKTASTRTASTRTASTRTAATRSPAARTTPMTTTAAAEPQA